MNINAFLNFSSEIESDEFDLSQLYNEVGKTNAFKNFSSFF